jgi:hypothetical protein
MRVSVHPCVVNTVFESRGENVQKFSNMCGVNIL